VHNDHFSDQIDGIWLFKHDQNTE